MPNIVGAWFATFLLKQPFRPAFVPYEADTDKCLGLGLTKLRYFLICIMVIMLAILNKFLPALNTSKGVDPYDIWATVIAEIIIFLIPIMRKEKIFV